MKDYIGKKWGRLTAISFSHKEKHKHYYTFKCDCGNEKVLCIYNVQGGNTKSCGCYLKTFRKGVPAPNRTHNQSSQPGRKNKLYEAWGRMKERCHVDVPKNKYWCGKGIKICPEWENSFVAFKDWSESHGFMPGLSLDRIDNSKDYCPQNCRWVTKSQNTINAHLGKGGWKRDKNRKKIFLTLEDKGGK